MKLRDLKEGVLPTVRSRAGAITVSIDRKQAQKQPETHDVQALLRSSPEEQRRLAKITQFKIQGKLQIS